MAAGAAALAAPWYWLRRALPQHSATVRLGGLERDVEIVRDHWAIPHVFAQTTADLFFGQGYATAQDRLWQLELNRRVGSGTLAELFGPDALDSDRLLRRLGFRRAAAAEWEQLDAASRLPTDAYCAGVNAWIREAADRLPVEFALLRGSRPMPWTPLDCLAFGRYFIFGQGSDWQMKWLRGQAVARLGPDRALALEPFAGERPPRRLHLPRGLDYSRIDYFLGGPRARGSPIAPPVPAAPRGGASNGWAIAPSRSASGGAILANDPHIGPGLPASCYEVHLCGAGYDVIGASLPGAPGVVFGRNQHIAWGFTTALFDANDIYVEHCDGADPTSYRTNASTRERAEVVTEHIAVKGWSDPVVESVRITGNGPIINPAVPPGERDVYQLALRSVALEGQGVGTSLLALNRASSWDEFRAALAQWPAVSFNFVYADSAGHIGRQAAGRVPVRPMGDGLLPVPGWEPAYEWTGTVPFEALPSEFDPPSGYVVAANHDVMPADCAYDLGHEWLDPYRVRRISQLLGGNHHLDRAACQRMQGDAVSLAGRLFRDAALILRDRGWLVPDGRAEVLAFDLLERWDGSLAPDSAGAAVYTMWRRALLDHLYEPAGGELAAGYLGRGPHPLVASTNTCPFRHSRLLVERLTSLATVAARGKEAILTADERALRRAFASGFRSGVAELQRRAGDTPSRWSLGRIHRITFAHAFGTQPVVGRLFNRGPLPVPGDSDTVFVSPADPGAPYDRVAAAPGYRLIVDFGGDGKATGGVAGGQSGHPVSADYANQLGAWQQIEGHPLLMQRAAVQRAAQARLWLLPETPLDA